MNTESPSIPSSEVETYTLKINDRHWNSKQKKRWYLGIKIPKFPSNYIKTTKYSWWSFIFLNLFNQFKKIGNIYFTIIMIIAFIPGVWPSSPVLAVIPLVIILGVNIIREGAEDFFRYLKDRKVNMKTVKCLVTSKDSSEFVETQTQNLKVGDIVKVEEDVEFPADLLLVSSNLEYGSCSIETSNLDGETTLKPRFSPGNLWKFNSEEHLKSLKGQISCENPNEVLYRFMGALQLEGDEKLNPISHQNLLLKGSILRCTHYIYGIVIYTGKDTKMSKNTPQGKVKFSFVNKMLNYFMAVLFVVMIFFCVLFTALGAHYQFTLGRKSYYLGPLKPVGISDNLWAAMSFLTYVVLFNMFVPVSLFVTFEFVKMIQARFISSDKNMRIKEKDPHSDREFSVRASAISTDLHSDLSQIDLILTDKTGTLTENSMKFNKLWIQEGSPSGFLYDTHSSPHNVEHLLKDLITGLDISKTNHTDDIAKVISIMMSLLNLSLCHNVTVRERERNGTMHTTYEGESSDEIALVHAAGHNGFKLKYCSEKKSIVEIFGKDYTFERVLEVEFTSERKRMSVLFKIPFDLVVDFPFLEPMMNTQNNQSMVCFIKGADSEMGPLLDNSFDLNLVHKIVEQFSKDGLRSLLFAYRLVLDTEAETLSGSYHLSRVSLDENIRKTHKDTVSNQLERNLLINSVSGVEDKLQKHVPETVEFFQFADVKVWMATGDSKHAAIHVAKSAKILSDEDRTHILHFEMLPPSQIKEKVDFLNVTIWESFKRSTQMFTLFIDGHVLDFCKGVLVKDFIQIFSKCKTVICYRSTPKQKSYLTDLATNKLKLNCLCIGDGANDVPMIQKAKVGVGIIGKEGTQAKLASDYAIPKFYMLKRLMVTHGRYSFKRSAQYIQYSFYKNNVIAFVQVLYTFYTLYSGQAFVDNWIITFHNYIFTLLNPFVFGLVEKDITEEYLEDATTGPTLYKKLRKEHIFNIYTFIKWILGALIHACIIFFFNLYGTEGSLLTNGQEDGLWLKSCLVYVCVFFVVTFKCYFEMEYYTITHHIIMALSVIIFVGFICIYSLIPSNISFVLFEGLRSVRFWLILLLVVMSALSIDLLFTGLKNWIAPDYYTTLKSQKPKSLPPSSELNLLESGQELELLSTK